MGSVTMTILTIALLVVCAAMIIVVVVQTNRGQGMSAAVTGQGNYYSKNRNGDKAAVLRMATIVISIIFAALVIMVSVAGYLGW